MSLGKKEGEVAGFQDQLKRAMDALQSSDDAVEVIVSYTIVFVLKSDLLTTSCTLSQIDRRI